MYIDELPNNTKLKILVQVGTKNLEFEVDTIDQSVSTKEPHYVCATAIQIEGKPVSFNSEMVKIRGIQAIYQNQIVQWSTNVSIKLFNVNGQYMYFIPCKASVKPLNRRSAFRVPMMQYGHMMLQRKGSNYNVEATITDMSIFGIGLVVAGSTDVEANDMLIVKFEDEVINKSFSIRCVAVRTEMLENGKKKVGCRMAIESQAISTYLSEKQRLLLEHDRKYYHRHVKEK